MSHYCYTKIHVYPKTLYGEIPVSKDGSRCGEQVGLLGLGHEGETTLHGIHAL